MEKRKRNLEARLAKPLPRYSKTSIKQLDGRLMMILLSLIRTRQGIVQNYTLIDLNLSGVALQLMLQIDRECESIRELLNMRGQSLISTTDGQKNTNS